MVTLIDLLFLNFYVIKRTIFNCILIFFQFYQLQSLHQPQQQQQVLTIGGSVRIKTCDLELPNNQSSSSASQYHHQNGGGPQTSNSHLIIPSHPPPAAPLSVNLSNVPVQENSGAHTGTTQTHQHQQQHGSGGTGGSGGGGGGSSSDGGRAVENQYSFV